MIYYIYGLYKDNEIIYIGRSFSPYERSKRHKQDIDFDYCKILSKHKDPEIKSILKHLKEGARLLNKLRIPASEKWNVGDIVHFKKYIYGIK